MESMLASDFKANFSRVFKRIPKGEEIDARIVPASGEKKQKRKLGIFEATGKVVFKKNFSITEVEFLGS